MGKELAFTTSAFISTDNLETFYAKKSDVICFWFPLRCVCVSPHASCPRKVKSNHKLEQSRAQVQAVIEIESATMLRSIYLPERQGRRDQGSEPGKGRPIIPNWASDKSRRTRHTSKHKHHSAQTIHQPSNRV